MVLVNPRSVANKLDEMEMWIRANNFHVISVVETWLHSSILDELVAPRGYLVFRKDRQSRGGGVCVVVDAALSPESVMPNPNYHDLEIIFVDLHPPGLQPTRLATVYCPPRLALNGEYVTRIAEYIRSMTSTFLKIIVVGDFNRPGIRWTSWDQVMCSGPIDLLFRDTMGDLGLTQIATFPTRGDNFLSLVFCSDPHDIESIEPLPPFNNSDSPPHLPIAYNIRSSPYKPANRTVTKNFSAIDYEWANSELQRTTLSTSDSAESIFFHIYDTIQIITDSAPPRRFFKRRPPAWDMARIKKRAWRILRANPTIFNHHLYNSISESYAETVMALHSERLNRLCNSKDCKAFYSHFSTHRHDLSSTALLQQDGRICINDSERAQTFLQSFDKVYNQDCPIDFSRFSSDSDDHNLHDQFSPEVISKLIRALKVHTATGPDGIPAEVIKNTEKSIAPLLSSLFQKVFYSGWIPPIWQMATIIPIYKGKGLVTSVENYRPIALTCIIAKTYERCLMHCLLPFLTTTGLIPPSQFGGLPGRSSTLQLVYCYNQWTSFQNSNTPFDVFYLDISKAFDRVPRSKLASCLCDLGLPHILIRAIMRLFDLRQHQVKVGTSFSTISSTASGVVQGTVLGCILFIIYTAPLTTLIRPIVIHAFIDDIKWSVVGNQGSTAQAYLNKIISWLEEFGLEISISKTCVQHYGSSNVISHYNIKGSQLESCSNHSDLGVNFCHDLKFKLHIETIVLKANRALFAILSRYKGCDRTSLILAFKTYVRPILEYASPVWSPGYVTAIDYIEKIQRSFTRKLLASHYMPYPNRCAYFNIHSLEWRRLFTDLCVMYRILDDPIYLPPLECPVTVGPPSITRGNSRRVRIPFTRNNVRSHSFFVRTPALWNLLPENIVTSTSLESFKSRLKGFDLSPHCFRYPF